MRGTPTNGPTVTDDRRTLGEALVDGRSAPGATAPEIAARLEQARAEQQAVAYATERANQEVDRLPVEIA